MKTEVTSYLGLNYNVLVLSVRVDGPDAVHVDYEMH